MFGNTKENKIKNDKIHWSKIESSCICDIQYRPGRDSLAADTVTRVCTMNSSDKLKKIKRDLCYPNITCLYHFGKVKINHSLEKIENVTNSCRTLCHCKPLSHNSDSAKLIEATQPFEHLNIDFKGPLPYTNNNKYFLWLLTNSLGIPLCFLVQTWHHQVTHSTVSNFWNALLHSVR